MATFLAHIHVAPGREADFEAVAARIWAATHADEPAARLYQYWRGAEPSTYYALGSFDDYAGFITHQVSDHHTEAGALFKHLIASMRLEWVDPVPGASGLAATAMSPEPPDASELASMYFRRMPAEEQAWWKAISTVE